MCAGAHLRVANRDFWSNAPAPRHVSPRDRAAKADTALTRVLLPAQGDGARVLLLGGAKAVLCAHGCYCVHEVVHMMLLHICSCPTITCIGLRHGQAYHAVRSPPADPKQPKCSAARRGLSRLYGSLAIGLADEALHAGTIWCGLCPYR
jgi:hypothetical protein